MVCTSGISLCQSEGKVNVMKHVHQPEGSASRRLESQVSWLSFYMGSGYFSLIRTPSSS